MIRQRIITLAFAILWLAPAATAATYQISGAIFQEYLESGFGPVPYPLLGVQVNLSGSQSATTTTDSNGQYVFTGLAGGGNYTVTPYSLNTYSFNPASIAVNNLSADQTQRFFLATIATTGAISGYVTAFESVVDNSEPLGGVKVTLRGSQSATTYSGHDGFYYFTGLPASVVD